VSRARARPFRSGREWLADYRTWVSGVEAGHLKRAPSLEAVVRAVSDMTDKRILVGHALKNDLHALMLSHPKQLVRDTSHYPGFRRKLGGKSRPRKLRDLSRDLLGLEIQTGRHDPVSRCFDGNSLFVERVGCRQRTRGQPWPCTCTCDTLGSCG
jgi:RNA exonuclease 4